MSTSNSARRPFRLTFGKHVGKTLDEVPINYLFWMAKTLSGPVRSAAEAELDRRNTDSLRPVGVSRDELAVAVKSWFAALSKQHHPDRGGTTDGMAAVNDAHDSLKAVLRERGLL